MHNPTSESNLGCLEALGAVSTLLVLGCLWACMYAWAIAALAAMVVSLLLLAREARVCEGIAACEQNMRRCGKLIRDHFREHGEYPSPQQARAMLQDNCDPTSCLPEYEYYPPPANSPGDFIVLRYVISTTPRKPASRSITVEMQLNGTIRRLSMFDGRKQPAIRGRLH